MPYLWLIHHEDDDNLDHTHEQEKSNRYHILNRDRERQIRAILHKRFHITLPNR